MDDARKVTFPTGAWIAAGVFALLMIGLLAGNLAGIGKQKALLEQQLAEIDRTSDAAIPALKDARPILDDARGRLPETRRAARDLADLVREARPLIAEMRPLLRETAGTGLVDRLAALTVHTEELLERIDRHDAVERVPEIETILRETLGVQRSTLAAQLESLGVQKQTLAIQQEALKHIRSIDAKTGGTAPAALP